MEATELMKGAIDIHIHIGPDPNQRRRVNGYEAAVQAKEADMRGVVFKSHDYNTTPVAYTVRQLVPGIEIFGGVSLDFEVGGLNPHAVEAAGKLGAKIVWMPTFSSKNDMAKRRIKDKGITILDENGNVLPVVRDILALIKQYDMVLSTGHLSKQEIVALLREAEKNKIERILITHPLSIRVGPTLSIDEQRQMMGPGIYFEHCFISCMPSSDRLDPQAIADAVRAVGPEHCILSTDFGQITNPPPVEGMRMYIETLLRFGVTRDEIVTMVKTNPSTVLGLATP
ncbi:MAG: hypothetical protein HQ561_17455 [Desulfobacteraceae bacterium]|nr:hypothetical protein [Desulfobacteraceae bacterium]